jgi:hypothetical protein
MRVAVVTMMMMMIRELLAGSASCATVALNEG